jgi:hypothetical protein
MKGRSMSSAASNLPKLLLSVVVCFALLALLGSAAATASPARYVLEKCDSSLPQGGVEGIIFSGPAPYTPGDNCAEAGGALIILQGGPTASSSAHWSVPLPAPPGGETESVTVTAEPCGGSNHDAGTVAYAVSPPWALPSTCGPETRTFPIHSRLGAPGTVWLGCEGQCAEDPFIWAHYFAALEVDPVAPVVEPLSGSLVSGGPRRGEQILTATATDEGGGVADIALHINGQPVGTPRSLECRTAEVADASVTGTVATQVTPCPPNATTSWTLDTSDPPFQEGPNTISVCATDFSTIGPANEGCATQEVKVDDSCGESSVSGGEDLHAVFGRNHRQQTTVANGHPAMILGRIEGPGGTPLAGAGICVTARTLVHGATRVPLATVVTNAEGHFSYRLPPGPNRVIALAYRHESFQVERHLRYNARAFPSLGVSATDLHNGQWVHFRGRLSPPDRRGRVVVLQANVKGSKRWITFRKATSAHGGIFEANYHFISTTRPTYYRFRAVVPTQGGYPWAEGHSDAVTVRVNP